MLNKLLLLSSACLLLSPVYASADTIFSLNNSACSTGCAVAPAGTVTLHQNGTNDVLVTVQLTNDYSFREAPDSNHLGFGFNLRGVTGVSATHISSGPTAQTFTLSGAGSYKDAGLGNFQYAFECTSCAVGASSKPTQMLSFDLVGNGLLTSSFVSNGTNFFGVDVVGLDSAAGVGLTGNIGATGPGVTPVSPSPVPEPSSLLLLGSGLSMGAAMIRRKLA